MSTQAASLSSPGRRSCWSWRGGWLAQERGGSWWLATTPSVRSYRHGPCAVLAIFAQVPCVTSWVPCVAVMGMRFSDTCTARSVAQPAWRHSGMATNSCLCLLELWQKVGTGRRPDEQGSVKIAHPAARRLLLQEFPEVGAALEPLMARYGVAAYFCGHEHNLQHLAVPGQATQHVVSGGGSQVSPAGSEGGLRPEVKLFHAGSGGRRSHPV